MNRVALTGLVQIDLPDATLRYCDGGFFHFNGSVFRSHDPVFGTIRSVEPLTEGVGDSIPALTMTLLPPDTSAAAELARPGNQQSRVRFWIAEYDVDAGTISSAEVQFDGQIDQAKLQSRRGEKELTMTVVSLAERLFEGNIGNSLNPTWHKSVWPGERGQDNATGLGQPIAWGVEGPRAVGGGYGGGGGLGRFVYERVFEAHR